MDGNLSYRLVFPAGLALYAPDGALIAETAETAGRAGKAAEPEWLSRALGRSEPVIARLYRDDTDGKALMTMAAVARDAAGRPLAVIAGSTGLLDDAFLKPVYEEKIGERGSVLVIDPEANLIVTSSLGPKVLAPAAVPGVNPMHDKARAGLRGVGETVNADGQHVLSAVVSIPSAGWFLVVQQPTDQAYLPVQRFRKNLLLIGGLTILIATFVIYSSLSYLFGPLNEIALRLRGMAKEGASIDFLPLRRDDEIGLVVTSFNALLSSLRANEALITHVAHHDVLTDLPNLHLFRDRLAQSLLQAKRSGGTLALLYLDLDGFKPVNDSHGHHAGDAVLKTVAQRLSALLRKSDTVARIGGDEFAVILVDNTGQAELVAEKCRTALRQPIAFEGKELSIGVSIGIAHFPGDGSEPEELLRRADSGMYDAKRAARAESGEACKSTGSPL